MYYKTTHTNENNGHGGDGSITIRFARLTDREALFRVAQRDSKPLPEGPLMVAEVGDEIRAATAVRTGDAIADPFHSTAELVRMLALRIAQENGSSAPRNGLLRRVLHGRRGAAPQPAGTLRPVGESAGRR
jgi:hypothetical protein